MHDSLALNRSFRISTSISFSSLVGNLYCTVENSKKTPKKTLMNFELLSFIHLKGQILSFYVDVYQGGQYISNSNINFGFKN